jgi:hypothetical protein
MIKDINVGEKLWNGSYVTAKIKVLSSDLQIYNLNNNLVSGTHLLKFENKWIRVKDHPWATKVSYNKEYLYCLNTSNKIIEISNIIFSDWDEINDDEKIGYFKNLLNIKNLENIHEFLDDGFEENTLIKLVKNEKEIKNIMMGDILENGSIVYGLVEIEASKLRKYKNKIAPNKLYHLLTIDGNLNINSKNIKDYNNIIDKFII